MKVINTAVSPAPYAAGDNVTFTITIYNQGTLDATNVIVEDYIRDGFIFNPSDNPMFAMDNFGNVETTIDFLAVGDTEELSITLEIDPNYQGTDLINDAEITSAVAMIQELDGQSTPAPNFPDIDSTPGCLLYTSPSPRDRTRSRMPSSA